MVRLLVDCLTQPFNSFEHRKHTTGISNYKIKIKKSFVFSAFLSYSQRFDYFDENNATNWT